MPRAIVASAGKPSRAIRARPFTIRFVGSLALTCVVATVLSQNVVVVAIDGLRPNEVFTGPERRLMKGVENEQGLVDKFWRDEPAVRREQLMPFLWRHLAREGQVFGNAKLGSPMRVTNEHRCSYPGYNEMLTGVADPRVEGNAHGDNENVTVFEWAAAQGRATQVFATWDAFYRIFNVKRSKLDVRAGLTPPFAHDSNRTAAKDAIDGLYRTATPFFGGNALDSFTVAALKESLRTEQPQLLFIGLGETDEWMHAGRYDMALEAIHRADAMVADLWATLQAMPKYRETTTLIVTTDHGRGWGERNWREHGRDVPHAQEIWAAVCGPGISPLGERSETGPLAQGQVASTVAAVLGYDWKALVPGAPAPLPTSSPAKQRLAQTQLR